MKKAILFIIGGMLIGKAGLDRVLEGIFPSIKSMIVVGIILVIIGLYFSKKEGGLKLPRFLKG